MMGDLLGKDGRLGCEEGRNISERQNFQKKREGGQKYQEIEKRNKKQEEH